MRRRAQIVERHNTYLRDSTLHDQEIWIVDVELHALEQILDRLLLGFVTVEKVLGDVGHGDLQSEGQLRSLNVQRSATWRVTVI